MRTRDPRSGGAHGVDGQYNMWRSGAPGPHAHRNCGQPEGGSAWAVKTVKRPPQQPAQPRYANYYWAPRTNKRHLPQLAQPWHTNHWAPQTR